MIPLDAARFPRELTPRAQKPYGGLAEDQCSTRLASHRSVHLALTASCLWPLTLLQYPLGPLADRHARQSRGCADAPELPATPPRAPAVRAAADFRSFRYGRGLPPNRAQR